MPSSDDANAVIAQLKTVPNNNPRTKGAGFSAFEAFAPNENSMSRMLKYLFSEDEGHGKGRLFLDQFLKLIHRLDASSGRSYVNIEDATEDRRRIDIVIRFQNLLVGIENKLDAVEQTDQCEDYCQSLERASQGRDWCLVFLTPNGRIPCTAGPYSHGPNLVSLSYEDLASALQTSDELLSPFLSQFRKYVQRRLLGVHEMDEFAKVATEPDNIEVTARILARSEVIQAHITEKLRNGFLQRVRESCGDDWQVSLLRNCKPARTLNETYSGLYFYKPHWHRRYAIALERQGPGRDAFIFGVWYFSRELYEHPAEPYEALRSNFESGKQSAHWNWYDKLSNAPGLGIYQEDWHSDEAVLQRMAVEGGRKVVDDLFPLIKKVVDVAERHIDAICPRDGNA